MKRVVQGAALVETDLSYCWKGRQRLEAGDEARVEGAAPRVLILSRGSPERCGELGRGDVA